ncbi:RNA-binding protein [Citricoccus sp. SGAir0253]|uniref:Jag family protein n=1 Tax=Citricoccus sp. SGAir0253 TaxID=2567881 RepID=UPI0010CD0343|nr:R3H domain-containing nucleic acid-binding protein [Citricoccus sp. SGAir0253]QCU79209.1 RNA-binding protein [Citricoccus sp. SGAir0253]
MTDVSASTSGDAPETTDAVGTTDAPAAQPVDNSGDNPGRPVDEDVDGAASEGSAASSPEAGTAESPSASRLEEEGDIAADYIEELLDISDLDGDIDIEVRNGRTYLSVIAEEGDDRLRDLVGPEGKGLEALQELVRLAVLSATGNRSRLVLDIAGHRAQRAGELETLAQEAIAEVRESRQPVHLKPMGAYERKIVHDVIADAGLVSESEGEGPRRHVVVSAGD